MMNKYELSKIPPRLESPHRTSHREMLEWLKRLAEQLESSNEHWSSVEKRLDQALFEVDQYKKAWLKLHTMHVVHRCTKCKKEYTEEVASNE